MDYLETLGNRIMTSREALGMSQRKFALMVGVNQGHLSELENGEANIKFLTLVKIAEGLNTTVEELVKGM